jgi:small multidrug resistance pump
MSQGALLLAFAILFEVIGTTCMKLSEGFTRLWPSLGIVVFYVASFTCLTLALRHLQVSVAYAIWAGLGTVLITIIGVVLFHEPMSAWRAACIALVLVGVIGLNLSHG